jgi:predicted metalloprotease with PDZ domain
MKYQTHHLLLVLLVTLAPFVVRAQTDQRMRVCEVTFDLQNVTGEKDRVKVTAVPPLASRRVVEYAFPSVIPGIYGSSQTENYISEIAAFDDRGHQVRVHRRKNNTFRFHLRKGRSLRRVEYWVDDVFDAGNATGAVPQASATRFESGKEFMLQPAFMIGSFTHAPDVAYRITVTHPQQIFAVTALPFTHETKSRDKFFCQNYQKLIDQPILYGEADTLNTTFGHITLRVAVTGTQHAGRARIIRRVLSPQISAMQQLTNGSVPLSFLMIYRFDATTDNEFQWSGAEHEGCGYFCLPDVEDENQLAQMVDEQTEGTLYRMLPSFTGVLAQSHHEMFREIAAVPEVWWFGNGMAGYMNLLATVRDSSMSEELFMEKLRMAIQLSESAPKIPFSDQKAIARALARPDQAAALRARALVTVFLLDIQLVNMTQTNNNLGLQSLFMDMLEGKQHASNEELKLLIAEKNTSNVTTFFANYVYNVKPLPLVESLEMIGWAYAPDAIDSVLSFGFFTLQYMESNDAFYVRTAAPDNLFGLRTGDRILSVDGVIVGIDNFEYAMLPVYEPEEGLPVSLRFIRGNTNDERTVIPELREELVRHFVRIDPAATQNALVNRNRLLHCAYSWAKKE